MEQVTASIVVFLKNIILKSQYIGSAGKKSIREDMSEIEYFLQRKFSVNKKFHCHSCNTEGNNIDPQKPLCNYCYQVKYKI